MKKLLRVFSIILCLSLLLGMAQAETLEYPFTDENGNPLELSWFCYLYPASAAVLKNRGESQAYSYWMDKFGLKIDWEHPSGDLDDAFNLLIASGEYPDIIEYGSWPSYPGGPDQAIDDGIIVDLTEYMEKYCPNLMAYFEKNPLCRYQATTSSGRLWAFSKIYPDEAPWYGIEIRKDLLDDFGLEVPETIDDWYNVLTTFKNNGIESPLSFEQAAFDSYGCFIGAYGILRGFYVNEDGTIHYGPIEDNYKEFLTTLNKWYSEGLIDKEFASIDESAYATKELSGAYGAWTGSVAEALGTPNATAAAAGDTKYKVVGAPYPKLHADSEKTRFNQFSFPFRSYYVTISTKCEHIPEICTALDWLVSQEGSYLGSFGFEGLTYTIDENGNPQPTEVITNDPDGNSNVAMLCKYGIHFGPFLCDNRQSYFIANDETYLAAQQTWKESATADGNKPPYTLTADESLEYSSIMAEINTYMDEMYLRFVMGLESLDNFEQYVSSIKGMGIERALEIQNAAYARYLDFANSGK